MSGKQILCARLEHLADTDITTEWQRRGLFAYGPHTEIAVDDSSPVRFNTAALYQLRKAIPLRRPRPDRDHEVDPS